MNEFLLIKDNHGQIWLKNDDKFFDGFTWEKRNIEEFVSLGKMTILDFINQYEFLQEQ